MSNCHFEEEPHVLLAEFRHDPKANPLPTPSGRIEIFSETVAGFGYDDCPGHPVWLEPAEWLGAEHAEQYPLHLISNQPSTRLHSQYDLGSVSIANKVQGHEPLSSIRTTPLFEALRMGISCACSTNEAHAWPVSESPTTSVPGVVVLPTGAWYDPETPGGLERHGNPNVLTLDKGASRLAQGPVAHTALVTSRG